MRLRSSSFFTASSGHRLIHRYRSLVSSSRTSDPSVSSTRMMGWTVCVPLCSGESHWLVGKKVFQKPRIWMGRAPPRPVSSLVLRTAPSKKVSPLYMRPPGHHQVPLTGSVPRSTRRHSLRPEMGLARTMMQSTQQMMQSLTIWA